MTHMHPPVPTARPAPATIAGVPARIAHAVLRRLARFPAAIWNGLTAVSHAIGEAAGMAYVDPYKPKRRDRR